MANEWILDVLADLKAFAQKNGLVALAEQLDDTTLIAASELASVQAGLAGKSCVDVEKTGDLSRAY